MPVRVLVVDDEPLARRRILDLLKSRPDFESAGTAGNGRDAIEAVRALRPDLVFLDVQMPETDGFGVIEAIGPDAMPPVVFVTAYDQYALRAFEVNALDYLLKPFDRERFDRALDRAAARLGPGRPAQGDLAARLGDLLREVRAGEPRWLDRVAVKSRGRIQLVRLDAVEWIEAAANYVVLHAGAEEHVLREPISRLESRLDPRRFLRCHRSSIVNVDAVKEIQPMFHGESVVILKSGRRIPLSRSCRANFTDPFRPE